MTRRKPGAVAPARWTEADIATMRAMCAAHASTRAIADALGRTLGAVATKRRQLGLLQDEAARLANIGIGMKRLPPEVLSARGRKAGSAGWTPERRNKARRQMKARMKRPQMQNLGNAVIAANPEILARRVAAMVQTKVGHCPPEYRAERRKLVKTFGSAVADEMIRDQIARDKRAASIAEAKANGWSMAFQAQIERVRAGAALVERVPLAPRGYDFSLTGGSLDF